MEALLHNFPMSVFVILTSPVCHYCVDKQRVTMSSKNFKQTRYIGGGAKGPCPPQKPMSELCYCKSLWNPRLENVILKYRMPECTKVSSPFWEPKTKNFCGGLEHEIASFRSPETLVFVCKTSIWTLKYTTQNARKLTILRAKIKKFSGEGAPWFWNTECQNAPK